MENGGTARQDAEAEVDGWLREWNGGHRVAENLVHAVTRAIEEAEESHEKIDYIEFDCPEMGEIARWARLEGSNCITRDEHGLALGYLFGYHVKRSPCETRLLLSGGIYKRF